MGFFELIKERHSTRSFKETKVEEEKLQKILHACNDAPSAGNLQAYEILVVKKKEIKQELADASHSQNFISQAPVVLVFFANPKRSSTRYSSRGEELYAVQDATIAVCYAQLAAVELGLATVWVGAFDDIAVSRALNALANLKPVAILPVGYAAEKPEKHSRRNLSDLVKKEHF